MHLSRLDIVLIEQYDNVLLEDALGGIKGAKQVLYLCPRL